MALKLVYDKIDDIPEQYRDLYTEKDGKHHLTGVVGMKTEEDVAKISEALRKEKNDHKDTKDKLNSWNGLNLSVDEVSEKLDKIPELEAAAKGNLDEEKINSIVEGRIKTKTAPLEREINQLKTDKDTLTAENEGLKSTALKRTISDEVRTAATKLKVIPEAVSDVVMLAGYQLEVTDDGNVVTKEGDGISAGLSAEVWLTDMQKARPYWWAGSNGGGAGGSGGGSGVKNPWSKDNWNLTDQGNFIKEHGRAKADEMAKSAGVVVGATKPAESK